MFIALLVLLALAVATAVLRRGVTPRTPEFDAADRDAIRIAAELRAISGVREHG
jgi:hypothetical protein